MPTLRLPAPADYDLRRDCCSYGYFLLAPNYWDPLTCSLWRPLRTAEGVYLTHTSQPAGPGTPLRTSVVGRPAATARREIIAQLTRMLRLDEAHDTIRDFHTLDPRWAPSGRGRLFRSPTLFEDVIKTVTSCNVTWPSTVTMNRRLSDVLGHPGEAPARTKLALPVRAFPTASTLARARPATLRARCRVGYRDARIVELGKRFSRLRGGIDAAWLENPSTPDDAVFDALIDLPGIGPYAAANIMQLMGRYRRLPLDTESVRHGRSILNMRGTPAAIMKRMAKHYAPFGPHAFRSYWLELWAFYESKHGPAWTWERDSTGRMFTAALLNKQA
jgi:3-methyladenine DNA glycosylase/8-oxoguanine DNA glycosylase